MSEQNSSQSSEQNEFKNVPVANNSGESMGASPMTASPAPAVTAAPGIVTTPSANSGASELSQSVGISPDLESLDAKLNEEAAANLNASANSAASSATPAAESPAANSAPPAANSAPVANSAPPAANSAPVANSAPPVANSAPPVANSAPPAANSAPAPAPAPAAVFQPIEPPVSASAPLPNFQAVEPPAPVTNVTRKGKRSNKQAAADAGQAAMLERLRNTYATEFANIPEKYRPKPKAYVARAAYYKPDEAARNTYIRNWLSKDRKAAEVRMGQRPKPAKPVAVAPIETPSLNSSSLNSANSANSLNFHPRATNLRTQAKETKTALRSFGAHATRKLLERAKDPATRKVAKGLIKEFKRQVSTLADIVKRQAKELERAAKDKAREELKTGAATRRARDEAGLKTRKANKEAAINSYND